jgi:hypothetical protein
VGAVRFTTFLPRSYLGSKAMIIARRTAADSFEAELTEGTRGTLWITAVRGRPMGNLTLRAVRSVGWDVVGVSESERRLLEAHGEV